MLVRIVYYLESTLPKEGIVVTNDMEEAERVARKEKEKLGAREFELEWVA